MKGFLGNKGHREWYLSRGNLVLEGGILNHGSCREHSMRESSHAGVPGAARIRGGLAGSFMNKFTSLCFVNDTFLEKQKRHSLQVCEPQRREGGSRLEGGQPKPLQSLHKKSQLDVYRGEKICTYSRR